VPAEVAVVDPIYNVPVAEPVAKRGDFGGIPISARDLTSEEFTDFLQSALVHIAGAVADGGVVYAFTDWTRLDELSAATRPYFGKPKNMAVWVNAKAGQGAFYRSQHRHVAVYVAGDMPTADKFRFGERHRLRSNVWSYAGAKCSHQDEATAATLKPVALVVDALRDSSRAGQIVLDPFGGIGTTMIAAERSGRRAHLIEIDPIYCDPIVRRWQTFSGKVAPLAEAMENFGDGQARRIRAAGDQE